MRCYICDVFLAEPTYNQDHQDWDPCETCKKEIQSTLDGFNDRPSIDEDEFGLPAEESLDLQLGLPYWPMGED